MPLSNPNQVKSRVRESTKSFIETLTTEVRDNGYRCPQETIVVEEDDIPEPRTVSKPGDLITLYSNRQDEFFRDVAEWLVSSGNQFPEKDRREDDIPTTVLGEPEDHPSKEESRVLRHENAVFNFAGEVLNYTGDLEFDEDAFDAAYEREFLENYETGLDEYEILIPLINFTGPGGFDSSEVVELDAKIEIHGDDPSEYHRVESVKLTTLDGAEAEALRTFEHNYRQRSQSDTIQSGQWAIRARVQSAYRLSISGLPGVAIGKRVVTALRLFSPKSGPVAFERAFELEYGWKMFRFGIPDIPNTDESHREPAISSDYYTLADSEIQSFTDFWNNLASQIQLNPSADYSTSLRRFNEMYVKPYPGDRLLDCIIACEGLLLRGNGNPGSKRSRMCLRGSILLDVYYNMDRETIRNRLKDAYDHRNDLVHDDKYLTEIINPDSELEGEKFEHPEDYLIKLRQLLGKVIVSYMLARNRGASVADINTSIDRAIEQAPTDLPGSESKKI